MCPVYRAGDSQGELYVCMRLLEQGTLASKVASEGPLPPEQAVLLLSQLASALDLAHSRSLCHRDVKAENVLLDASGNAYLADFGLAGAIWQQEEQSQLAGTLAYLAPERCQGSPALPASDQYALACLAYLLLAGEPPFVREHEAALMYAHLREDPPSLATHGLARADAVLAQALAKDPSSRYESCAAFAQALADALSRPERPEGETWPENLPRPATRLVGRQAELAEISALLHDPQTRLCTLTGPGGTGKTRLALQAAAEAAASFEDGVHWVSLAPLRDPAYCLSAIAQALEISEQPPASLQATLAEALQGKAACLLVLDNAEHLLPAIADDIALLRDIPGGPSLLVTSRERLDLQAERLYPVPSLQDSEAAELFSDRASYLDPAHDPSDPAIATLCERLDQLPLALELAAARSDLYSPSELLDAIEGHLELLTGARDHDPRHQTLHATIAWSYDLLSGEERRAFRSLSVFAGGCTAAAASEVAGADPALLQSLLAKSLLRTREAASGRRYFMLETVRQYAAVRVAEAGEEDVSERHSRFFCWLATESESQLGGSGLAMTSARLSEDTDNFMVALGHASHNDPVLLVNAASALRRHWASVGLSHEVAERIEAALSIPGGLPIATRALGLNAVGMLVDYLGDHDRAEALLDEAVLLFRQVGDTQRLRSALNNRGRVAFFRGDLNVARASLEECARLERASGDYEGAATTLVNLGAITVAEGEFAIAREALEDALALAKDDPTVVMVALYNLSIVHFVQGDVSHARDLALQELELANDVRDWEGVTDARCQLARCELAQGNRPSAAALLLANVADWQSPDKDVDLHETLWTTTSYAAMCGDARGAATLLGVARSLRDLTRGVDRILHEELLASIARDLDSSEIETLVAQGKELTLGQAVDLARALLIDEQ